MTQENSLARHTILHELGRGEMGAVYAARDRKTGAVVALKKISLAALGSPDPHYAEHFLKRIKSVQQLRHRNLVRIHDAGADGGTVYLAMEMLKGESLRKILDAGPLPIARAIRIAREIAAGLAYAHLQGVVHGAIKPSSILVLHTGVVKITDFGVAKVTAAPADHRSDILALGVVLYEMLTHRAPAEKPAPPSELNPHVPRSLDSVVLSMLARQPADRMPGIPILIRELERLEEGLGLGAIADAVEERHEPELRINEPIPDYRPEPSVADPVEHRQRIIDREATDHQRLLMDRELWTRKPARSRAPLFVVPAVLLVMVGAGVAGYMHFAPDSDVPIVVAKSTPKAPPVVEAPPPIEKAAPEPAPVKQVAAKTAPLPKPAEPVAAPDAPPITPPPVAEPIKEAPAPQAAPAGTGLIVPPSMTKAPRQPEEPQPVAAAEPAPPPQPKQQMAAKAPQQPARLTLEISPGGEIYIDGKYLGETPPMTSFDLDPGMYRVEIRSGSRKPFLTYMTVEPGDARRIRHDFNAKPSRPPG